MNGIPQGTRQAGREREYRLFRPSAPGAATLPDRVRNPNLGNPQLDFTANGAPPARRRLTSCAPPAVNPFVHRLHARSRFDMMPGQSGRFDGIDVFYHPQNQSDWHHRRHAHRVGARVLQPRQTPLSGSHTLGTTTCWGIIIWAAGTAIITAG